MHKIVRKFLNLPLPLERNRRTTGCYRMTAKKFEHSTHSKMPHMSCKICHFFRESGTFAYHVSKNYNIQLQKYQRGKEIDFKNEKYSKFSKFKQKKSHF